MAIAYQPGYHWTTKPPRGSQVDRSHPLAESLRAAYVFNEGVGPKLWDLANQRSVTLNGSWSWKSTLKGNGLHFAAASSTYAQTLGPTGIVGNPSVELEAIVSIDDTSAEYACVMVGDAGTAGGGMGLEVNTRGAGVVSVEFYGNNPYTSAAPALVPGQVYHLRAVKTPGPINSTTRVYINGVDYGSSSASTATPNITNAPATVGAYKNGATQGAYLNGTLLLACVRSPALPGATMDARRYREPYAFVQAPTMRRWPLGTGPKTTVGIPGFHWIDKPPRGSQFNSAHPLARSTNAAFLLNEGVGFKVRDIARRNIGTASGGVTWTKGPKGPALNFDGTTGSIDCGANPGNYTNSTPFSIGAIINPVVTGNEQVIYGTGTGINNPGYHIRITSGGRVRCAVYGTGGGNYKYMDSNALAAGWHQVWGVWTGAALRVFVDGTEQSITSGSSGTVNLATTNHAFIGQSGEVANPWWYQGQIAGVWSIGRALSPADVRWFWRDPFAPVLAPASRRWLTAQGATTKLIPLHFFFPAALGQGAA